MAGEWRDYKVGDLFDLKPGFAFKSTDFIPSGAPVIKIKNVKAGSVVLDGLSYVDEVFLDTKKNYAVHYGDILITMSGNRFDGSRDTWVGKVAPFLSYKSCLLNQRVAILKPKTGHSLDRRCCSYILSSPDYQDLFIAIATSSGGQANLSPGQILGADILLPPYTGQRAIAHILGTLDDKIELNRRMNETLEAMAQALFTSWFVDFDPVRAKAEGRDPGLPKPLAALFPDSFDDSEMGEIPKGWSAHPLYDIATYINGAAYAAFQPNDERRGFPIIKIAELKAGVTGQTKFSDIQMPEKYRITKGDILFSWSGNPDTSIDTFVWSAGPGWLNQHIFKVLPRRLDERAFVLSTLKTLRPVFAEIARNKQTTGLGHVTAEDMKRLLVARPDDRVMQAWDAVAAPFHGRTFNNALEADNLSKLRDMLLPRLISGELRVKNAERFLEDRGL